MAKFGTGTYGSGLYGTGTSLTKAQFLSFAQASLPRFLFVHERPDEVLNAFACLFANVSEFCTTYFDQTLIIGATNLPPDFLDLHARDRNSRRQLGELDNTLRDRLRNFPDALTEPALESAAQEIVDAAGIVGTFELVELRLDKAFFQTMTKDTGTGGTFATGPVSFVPLTTPGTPRPRVGDDIIVSGAASAGNNGTFSITGVLLDNIQYTNGGAVAEVDATVTWEFQERDSANNITDGFQYAYFDRGYRFGNQTAIIIAIIPFTANTTIRAATASAIAEMLRQKKGAGVLAIIESRLT